jgi:hypothetical protein
MVASALFAIVNPFRYGFGVQIVLPALARIDYRMSFPTRITYFAIAPALAIIAHFQTSLSRGRMNGATIKMPSAAVKNISQRPLMISISIKTTF